MQDRGRLRSWLAGTLALAACSFDGRGIPDDVPVDAAGVRDRDRDGVLDDDDNCPDVANPGQHDEDGDGVGNACDNCPHVFNPDQTNVGEVEAGAVADGAGDACDPDPAGPGNDLLYFDGFDHPGAIADWRMFLGGSWSIRDGAMRQTSTTGVHAIYLGTRQFAGGALDTAITIDALPTSNVDDRGIGTLMTFSTGPNNGVGYLCVATMSSVGSPPTGALELRNLRGSQPPRVEDRAPLDVNLEQDVAYLTRHQVDVDRGELECGITSTALQGRTAVSADDKTHDLGFIGLRTQFVSAHFDYVVVFAMPEN